MLATSKTGRRMTNLTGTMACTKNRQRFEINAQWITLKPKFVSSEIYNKTNCFEKRKKIEKGAAGREIRRAGEKEGRKGRGMGKKEGRGNG